jgi:hypothetical protein
VAVVAPAALAQPITLGSLHGAIEFHSVSAPVAAYLAGNAVVAGSDDAVSCFRVGEFSAAVSTSYAVENLTPAPDVYRLASYSADPPVEAGGTDFLMEVDRVDFSDSASYRHGSRQGTAPAASLCPGVEPVADDPAGTTCDASECAALLNVTVRLTGAAADLAALVDPAGCAIDVRAEDVPGTGIFSPQATSAPTLALLAQLTGPGVVIPVLVRADAALEVYVGCTTQLVDGEEGFDIDPETGMALFADPVPLTVTAGCGAAIPIDADVPVDRPAGTIKGMFDLAGLTATAADVEAIDTPYVTNPPLFGPGQSPVRDDPTSYWTLEDVHEGAYKVIATGIVDDGDAWVRFPSKSGGNGPAVVSPGVETDLDAFFVADPQPLEGHVTLIDLGTTALDELEVEPFTSLNGGSNRNSRTSRAEMRGDADVVPVGDGASGIEGYTAGRLVGMYDAAETVAEMDYRTYLVGPSDVGADLAGSEAKPTAWDFSRYVLRLGHGDDENVQNVRVYPGVDLHYLFEPGGETNFIPPQTYCFGQVELQVITDPATGVIWAPRIALSGDLAIDAETAVPNANYTVGANARGLPAGDPGDGAGSQALVYATVPEGIAYSVEPSVELRAAGSTAGQELDLPDLVLPHGAGLGCGDVERACLFLEGADGQATPLVIALEPGLPFCPDSGSNLELGVVIDSGGADVDYVRVALDGGEPQYLCIGCGPDPGPLAYPLASVAAGQHAVVIEARSVNGCEASITETFEVSDEPCVDVLPESLHQLAYADGDEVHVARLEDDLPHFVLSGLDTPERLTYDVQGERLAVVQDGSVLVVDAEDGSAPIAFPGTYTSVAFRPTDNRDIAFVEPQPNLATNGPFRVQVWLQEAGVTLETDELGMPEVIMGVGWSVPPPQIAWSADGAKLAAAFMATSIGVSPTERRLYLQEWTVDAGGLVAIHDPAWNWTLTGTRAIHQVGYLNIGGGRIGLLTDDGLMTVDSAGILNQGFSPQGGMVMAAFPNPVLSGAAYVTGTDMRAGVATDAGFAEGAPNAAKPRSVAMSAQLLLTAVVRSNGDLEIYRIGYENGQVSLALDRVYAGVDGTGLAFRPLSP